jgi:hypothetical protein
MRLKEGMKKGTKGQNFRINSFSHQNLVWSSKGIFFTLSQKSFQVGVQISSVSKKLGLNGL